MAPTGAIPAGAVPASAVPASAVPAGAGVQSWVILGAGRVGPTHAHALSTSTDAALLGVVDPDLDRARALAQVYGTVAWPDLTAMLGEVQPDAATVALPHDLHLPTIRALTESGVAALCEKPLARTAGECQEIVSLAARSAVPVGTVLNMRGYGYSRAILALTQSGALTPRRIQITGRIPRRPPADWLSDPARAGGGVLLEVGVHYLDLLQWWLGEPRELRCELEGEPVEHTVRAGLEFGGGCAAELSLVGTDGEYVPVTISIQADQGQATVEGTRLTTDISALADRVSAEPSPTQAGPSDALPYGHGHVTVIHEACAALRHRSSFPISAAQGARSVALAAALYGLSTSPHRPERSLR
jgi:UDP-N-acetyl-2-amino-2-deoxyglucuronate dehydrogenase